MRRHGQARRQLGGVRAQRVDAHGCLGRQVVRGHQRARRIRAQLFPPELRDPLRVGVAQRGLRRRGIPERRDQLRRLAGAAPQHRVDEPPAAGRCVLDQLDRLIDRRVRRHPVRVGELVQAEPQRRQHQRLELLDRAPRECLDQVVERRAALHRSVGEAHRERTLARVEPEPARLAVQRAVGPGTVLEDAPQDRKRACTCRCPKAQSGIRFVRWQTDSPLSRWEAVCHGALIRIEHRSKGVRGSSLRGTSSRA